MECSDWINFGAVIAIVFSAIVALSLGVSSLIQTRNMQKREYRDRLLNEITEWAMDIVRSMPETILPNLDMIIQKEKKEVISPIFFGLWLKLEAVNAKNKYIQKIATESYFGDKLNKTIEAITKSLNTVIGDLRKSVTAGNFEEAQQKLKDQINADGNLRQKLEALIREVAALKSKNLG